MKSFNRRQFIRLTAAGMAASAFMSNRVMANVIQSKTDVISNTAYGKIKGYRLNGVSIFKGVPYAGKVSGERRFLTPGKLKPWTGVRDANRLGAPSIQPPNQTYGIDEPLPDEDCLVLNIWTPANDNQKRPVMFYSHGGGFVTGSGGSAMQDGANLAQRYNVVVVETNHRLGLLGYLYLDEVAGGEFKGSGNRGVQDIAFALQWVNDNIAEFGGDPDNVMIFGESGGGMKTSCLYAMPQAAPYFNKASIESGPGVIIKTADEAAVTTEMLMKQLGIAKNNWQKLLEMSPQQILDAQLALQRTPVDGTMRGGFMGIGSIGTNAFGPVVDGIVLPNHPFDPTAPDISKDKPLITGWNEDEFIFFAMYGGDTSVFTLDRKGLEEKLQAEFGEKAALVLETYLKANPSATPAEIYIAIRSIQFMGLGSITIAEQKVKQGGAPAYLYNFGYKSELKVPGTDYAFGSMHAMDIPFKFYNISNGMAGKRPERFEAADNMCQLWTSFARNSKPIAKGQPEWEPYNLESRPTMRIDTVCSLLNNRYKREIDMWRYLASQSI
ncbi:carboxylesterase/lipase family protein [Carboxylicivirga caseinilyticus]|uniref:carboxylesterase/lipase family protein n=1 Tax=Carboxylicivirga caseinilyticus TaxID=3417572 RepID=UPI003D352CA7|nr:carboxylesterase/lipase family protein [Marinilabiliaceae bacterium A049]